MNCSRPPYRLVPQTTAAIVRREGTVYRASASLHFRLQPQPRRVTLAGPGLGDHVRGYAVIAQRVVNASHDSVQAVGATASQARARLDRAVNQLRADAQTELDREERLYDTVTDGGLEQNQGPQFGFPGGRDARARCAR